jgi:hypothetical protein
LLLIALAIIIAMVSTIVTVEASRYLAETIVFRRAKETSLVLVVVSIAIFLK